MFASKKHECVGTRVYNYLSTFMFFFSLFASVYVDRKKIEASSLESFVKLISLNFFLYIQTIKQF